MAELPEIETLRRELEREVVGKKVKSVEVSNAKVLDGVSASDLTAALDGAKFASLKRVALLLVVTLDNEKLLVFDLADGGFLRRNANKDKTTDETAVVITFTQGGQLRVLTGVGMPKIQVFAEDTLFDSRPELNDLGDDVVESPLSWTAFAQKLLAQTSTLRQLLADDTFIVGISDVYADEILHASLLMYDRTPDTLSSQEIRRLYRSVVEILHDAMKHRGTTIEGRDFLDLHGEQGGYGEYLQVHGRAGERSANGRGIVQRKKIGGTFVYFADYQV